MQDLAEKIKEKGVTKRQVAKMVGITQSTLSRILSSEPGYGSKETLNKINSYLDNLNTNDKNIFEK